VVDEQRETEVAETEEAEEVEVEVVEEDSPNKASVKAAMLRYKETHGQSPSMRIVSSLTGLKEREIRAEFEGSPYTGSGIENPPCFRG
jgi:hypothetical protein